MSDDFLGLAREKFVSLTTFKRSGEGVATPVWVVADDDRLVVWTPADRWEGTRAQRDPRVSLVPCGRTGKVTAGRTPVAGSAVVVEDQAVVSRAEDALRRKY